jgi:prepilin-type N-terminal cleavage/methylation domain-containing protein
MSERANRTVRHAAFTLIELLVVVAVISIIAAIVVPFLLGKVSPDADRQERAPAAGGLSRQPPPPDSRRGDLEPQGVLPDFDSASIRMGLAASHHRLGMDVYTRYEATYEGRFVIADPSQGADAARLDFGFPEGTTEAREAP